MNPRTDYTAVYSGDYTVRDICRFESLSKSAMRYWIAKDIKGSGYDTTKDAAGNYVCGYAREREQVLWDKWEFAQLPSAEQLKRLKVKRKPTAYLSQHLHTYTGE